MAKLNVSNIAVVSNLTALLNDSATAFSVTTAAGYPASDFKVWVDNEVILVNTRTGTNFTSVTRGHDGTVAAQHELGAAVRHVTSAEDFQTRLLGFPIPVPTVSEDGFVAQYDHSNLEFDWVDPAFGGAAGPWIPTTDYTDFVNVAGDEMTGGLTLTTAGALLTLNRTESTTGYIQLLSDSTRIGVFGATNPTSQQVYLYADEDALTIGSYDSSGGVLWFNTTDDTDTNRVRMSISGVSGDITLRDKAGSTVFLWDESATRFDMSANLNLQSNSLLDVATISGPAATGMNIVADGSLTMSASPSSGDGTLTFQTALSGVDKARFKILGSGDIDTYAADGTTVLTRWDESEGYLQTNVQTFQTGEDVYQYNDPAYGNGQWLYRRGPGWSSPNNGFQGTIGIKFPNISQMFSARVMLYNYSGASYIELFLGGYTYVSGQYWVNTTAHGVGNIAGSNIDLSTVRFVNKSDTNEWYVLLGTSSSVWAYPKVYFEILQGHAGSVADTYELVFFETGVTDEPTWTSSATKNVNQGSWTYDLEVGAGGIDMAQNPIYNVDVISNQEGAGLYLYATPSAAAGDFRIYVSDSGGVDRRRLYIPGSTGDIELRDGDADTVILLWDDSTGWWEFGANVDLNDNWLQGVKDPTADAHVGDRAYNDLRYAPITGGGYLPLAGGTMTGSIDFDGYNASNVRYLHASDTGLGITDDEGHDRITLETDGDIRFYKDDGTTQFLAWVEAGDALYLKETVIGQSVLVKLEGTSDATLVDETGVLQIGTSGGPNLGLDNNEIVARTGSGTAGTLAIQPGGGQTNFYGDVSMENNDIVGVTTIQGPSTVTHLFINDDAGTARIRLRSTDSINFYGTDSSLIALFQNNTAVFTAAIRAEAGIDMQGTSITEALGISSLGTDLYVDAVNNGAAAQDIYLRADDASGTQRTRILIDGDGSIGFYDNAGASKVAISSGNTSFAHDIQLNGNNIAGVGEVSSSGENLYLDAENPGAASQDLYLRADNASGTLATRIFIDGDGHISFYDNAGTQVVGMETTRVIINSGYLEMNGNAIHTPADPTSGYMVGDRDYNDARYAGIDLETGGPYLPLTGGSLSGWLAITSAGETLKLSGAASSANYLTFNRENSGRTSYIGHGNAGNDDFYILTDQGNIQVQAQDATGADFIVSADDSGGVLRERFRIGGATGDIYFTKIDASTSLLWDESDNRWELSTWLDMGGNGISSVTQVQAVNTPLYLDAVNTGAAAENIYLRADDATGTSRNRMFIDGDGATWLYDNAGTQRIALGANHTWYDDDGTTIRLYIEGSGPTYLYDDTGALRFYLSSTSPGDIGFRKLDGTTVSLLWDESDDRWEFTDPVSIGEVPGSTYTGLSVAGAHESPTATGVSGQAYLFSTTAQAADVGGSLSFGGDYNGVGETRFAVIGGFKENATSGQYGGWMGLYARQHGSTPSLRLKLHADGDQSFYKVDGSTVSLLWDESADYWDFNTDVFFSGKSALGVYTVESSGTHLYLRARGTSGAYNLVFQTDDAASALKIRQQIDGTGDINFFKVDGTTSSLLWDESDDRWEFADTPYDVSRTGYVASEPWVLSRGTNLVSNGFGLLEDNTNFSGFSYDETESFGGAGSFKITSGSTTKYNDEYMPIDGNKSYRFTYAIKGDSWADTPEQRHYGMTICYDIDKQVISPYNVQWYDASETTLAADLNPDDTTITLTSSTGWVDSYAAPDHRQSIIFFPYTNAKGYTYPDYTYSRHTYPQMWGSGAISGNVITLSAPWAGGSFAAGTKVANCYSGSGYSYIAGSNAYTPENWTTFTGTQGGWNTPGSTGNASTGFRQGTAYVRVGWLLNREAPANSTSWIDGVTFREDSDVYNDARYLELDGTGTMAGALEMAANAINLDSAGGSWSITTNSDDFNIIDNEAGQIRLRTRDNDNNALFEILNVSGGVEYTFGATGITLSGNNLIGPGDPTDGTMVGDRDYNDARYVNVTGDTMTAALTIDVGHGALRLNDNDTNNAYISFYDDDVGRMGYMGFVGYMVVASEDVNLVLSATSTGASAQNVVIAADDAAGTNRTRIEVDGDGSTVLYDSAAAARIAVHGTGTTFYGTASMQNNDALQWVDSGATARRLMLLSAADDIQIGAVDSWGNSSDSLYLKSPGPMSFIVNNSGTQVTAASISADGTFSIGNTLHVQDDAWTSGYTSLTGIVVDSSLLTQGLNNWGVPIDFTQVGGVSKKASIGLQQASSDLDGVDLVFHISQSTTAADPVVEAMRIRYGATPQVEFSGNITVLDPTAGTHVGDRDYNDARYLELGGGTMTGDIGWSNATFPKILMDTRSDGDAWTSQGALIAIGEAARDDSGTSMKVTYHGDGFGYVGMGRTDGLGITGAGKPENASIRFYYSNEDVLLSRGNSNAQAWWSNGDIQFYKDDGTTTSLLWDESDNQWEFSTTVNLAGQLLVASSAVLDSSTPAALKLADPSDTTKTLHMGYDITNDRGVISSVDNGTSWKNIVINPSGGLIGIGTGTTALTHTLNVAGSGHFTGTLAADNLLTADIVRATWLSGYTSPFNAFGAERFQNALVTNHLWAANVRGTVTITGDQPYSGGATQMFDGGWDSSARFNDGDSSVITIDMENDWGTNGITYPEGSFIVAMYYTNEATTITLRMKDKDDVWTALGAPDNNIATFASRYIYQWDVPGSPNYITHFEVSLSSSVSDAEPWITQIEYYPSRPSGYVEAVMFSKYKAQTLWFDLTMEADIDMGGNDILNTGYLSTITTADHNTDIGGWGFRYGGSGAANKPTGTDHAVMTMAYSTAWSVQLAGDWRTNKWYVREQNSGTWGSWDQILTTADTITDDTAIHDNVSGEISAVTAKATPTSADFLLIEDAAASNAKKRITIGDLPASGGSSTLSGLDDTVITSVADGEVLVWSTADWINQTLTEAGILGLAGGTMTGALAMGNFTLSGPLDPTAGTHVGDRDYNDARYGLLYNGSNQHSTTSAGWYRIAQNGDPETSSGGDRAHARFIVVDTTSSNHQSLDFSASVHFGARPAIIVHSNTSYGSPPPISGIRIVHNGTYDGHAVEIELKTGLNVSYYMVDDAQTAGWSPIDFEAGNVPSGFSTTEINLTADTYIGGAWNGGTDNWFVNNTGWFIDDDLNLSGAQIKEVQEIGSLNTHLYIDAENSGAAAQNIFLRADDATGTQRDRIFIDGDGNTRFYDSTGAEKLAISTTDIIFSGAPYYGMDRLLTMADGDFADYLLLAGGTMTGDIDMSGNVLKSVDADLILRAENSGAAGQELIMYADNAAGTSQYVFWAGGGGSTSIYHEGSAGIAVATDVTIYKDLNMWSKAIYNVDSVASVNNDLYIDAGNSGAAAQSIYLRADDATGTQRTRMDIVGNGSTIFRDNAGDIQLSLTTTGVFLQGAKSLSGIETLSSLNNNIYIDAINTGAAAQNIYLRADDTAGTQRNRIVVQGANDIYFYKVDGTTQAMKWAQSQNAWEMGTSVDLDMSGGEIHDSRPASSISSATTLNGTHNIVHCNANSAFTVTIPSVSTYNGKAYFIRRNGAGGNITIARTSTNLFEYSGSTYTSIVITSTTGAVGMYSDGSAWRVVGVEGTVTFT